VNAASRSRLAECVYIALVLGGAALLGREAGRLPPAPYDPLGPGSFPRWTAAALGGLGCAMALRLALGQALGEAAVSLIARSEGAHRRSPWTAAATLGLAFAYAILLSTRLVPFIAATAVYLFAAGAILGPPAPRRLGILALAAAVAAAVLDQAFRRLFHLDL
jgi:hypothetical protein